MIERDFNAIFLNSVANHPAVRPWLGPDESGSLESKLDLFPLLANGAIALVEPGAGGFLFIPLGQGERELHTMFLPDHRGGVAFRAACEAFDWIFTHADCDIIYTQLPSNNPQAKLLARRAGFQIIEPRESHWRAFGGEGDDAALTRNGWAERRAALAALTMGEPTSEFACPSQPQ